MASAVARLFVAAWPSPEILDLVATLPRPHERGVRWTRRDQWHVTLRFLGNAAVDEAADALARLDAPACTAVVGPQVARLGRFVVVVPVAGLDELAAAVSDVTAEVGEPPDPRPFAGHLTVARLRNRAACGLTGTPITGSFPVTEVHLVRSDNGPDGSHYETVSVVPLRQTDDAGSRGSPAPAPTPSATPRAPGRPAEPGQPPASEPGQPSRPER